jgi:hypothetical protein
MFNKASYFPDTLRHGLHGEAGGRWGGRRVEKQLLSGPYGCFPRCIFLDQLE